MRTAIEIICSVLILNTSLSAQNYKTVLIRANTKMTGYFPYSERYPYPEFIPGDVVFKNGTSNNIRLNYYYPTGWIEFLQAANWQIPGILKKLLCHL
jgi:hypothetical protein